MHAAPVTKVDHTALRVNQGFIIALLILAFLFDWVLLVAFVGAVMLIGTLRPDAGLFKLIYSRFLKPRGWLKPDVIADSPQPHLFAQGLGSLVLIAATVALLAGLGTLGWVLTGIVVVLAAVNLFLGFCAGCFIYYQLARRGIRAELPLWRSA
jgi:hypothetical protein